MLDLRTLTQPLRNIRALTFVLYVSITSISPCQNTYAQASSFLGDTFMAPYLFDLREEGVLHDFHFVDSVLILYIGRADGQGTNYDYIVRRNRQFTYIDTAYKNISPPAPNSFYYFDAQGQAITLGFGFHSTKHRYLISSADAGHTWDTIDIGDSAYYRNIRTMDAGMWLLESLSPFTGVRYVTKDAAYWVFHREWTRSWIGLIHKDSLLFFVGDNRCGRENLPDTARFQFLRPGELAENMTPVIVPAGTSVVLPDGSVCPRLMFVGFDRERIWFKREWLISYPDTQTNAFPTEFYTYNLQTGLVQFEGLIRHPRWSVRAILFADHLFVSTDSQMVVRHVNAPPGTPFAPVPGIDMSLRALQVHEGALYGSQSSGLIMRIRQVSSVPTSEVDETAAFTAEIQGSEISVFAVDGATPRDIPLELFDVQGRRLSASSIASGSSSGRLPAPSVPGVYFLRCGGSESSTTLRILIP